MEQYKNLDIVEVPLGSPHFCDKVSRFLGANGLRMEAMDSYYTVQDADGNILAGAGISKDIIKCVAVAPEARSEGLMVPLISRIVTGRGNLKVFTKPEYQSLFESLGFRLLGQAPKAILLENGRGLQQYCEYLKHTASTTPSRKVGVIVMNANPFTLGHKYLIDKALEQVDNLYVIPVKEDVSMFSYAERLDMICRGAELHETPGTETEGDEEVDASSSGLSRRSHVMVLDGSDYSISSATFPTYFLKDLTDASETQMRLDLDLFCKHIAPALGATIRFAGSEPIDKLTAQYNKLMADILPKYGIEFVEIPRTEVSATAVRKALAEGSYAAAAAICPETTRPYLLAALAERALRMELDTPLKPGLVCPESNGAHKDMDYGTMLKGIAAIRPFFPRMAMAGTPEELKQLGIDAENAMMAATGGVNTHRGAIFALGLALNAAFACLGKSAVPVERDQQSIDTQLFIENRRLPKSLATLAKQLIDSNLQNTPTMDDATTSPAAAGGKTSATVIGAKRMALTGYQQLFEDWLPFYRSVKWEDTISSASLRDPVRANAPEMVSPHFAVQRLLLHIMSTLDDTCIIKRVGKERAEKVKLEISGTSPKMTDGESLNDGVLRDLCKQFESESISPGGAADMVALTIFIDSII